MQRKLEELNGIKFSVIKLGPFQCGYALATSQLILNFQNKYPNIKFELLLGDYDEIEHWILTGRVDFGFLRLPTLPKLSTQFIHQDDFKVIVPKNHFLEKKDSVSLNDLSGLPFILLDKNGNPISLHYLKRWTFHTDINFTTWDDYAIMCMVEKGLGVSILPELILQRVQYDLTILDLDVPLYRKIGIAYKEEKNLSLASKKFLDLLFFE